MAHSNLLSFLNSLFTVCVILGANTRNILNPKAVILIHLVILNECSITFKQVWCLMWTVNVTGFTSFWAYL